MNVKSGLLLSLLLFLGSMAAIGQTANGYIISIEQETVNVDLTNAQVKAGDCLEVVVSGGYMTHPVTGRRVKKADEVLGTLEVGAAYPEYTVARPRNASLLSKLKAGMVVRIAGKADTNISKQETVANPNKAVSKNDLVVNNFVSDGKAAGENRHPDAYLASGNGMSSDKVNVVIAPAQVNDMVHSGHFGGYVADILMEQMLLCDKVRLLDRSVLNAQVDEVNLAGDILDPTTTIQSGKGIGARYILQTTMQKPDVVNIRTGIPLAGIMGAVQGLTGTNIGADYASNAKIATLNANVSISVRVVDLQTGEIVFMCSGSGQAKGKSQLSLEYGALGGGELNGGAEGFKQTVTGKAIQQAFMKIGRNLKEFFNGRTDRKVMGSVSGGASYGEKMYAKGYKLYMGTERLDRNGVSTVFSDKPELFFRYQKAKRKKGIGWTMIAVGVIAGVGAGAFADAEDALIVSGPISAPFIIGGFIFNMSGRRKLKKIASSYNASNSQYSYNYSKPSSSQCSLSLTTNGLRFTF